MQIPMHVKYILQYVDFNMIRYLIGALLFFHSQFLTAYSCIEESSIEDLFQNSTVALIGMVEKKSFELYFSKDKYRVTIKSLKKGNISSKKLTVWTKRRGRCGAIFEVGNEYVIFLNKKDGKYWTDLNSSWQVHTTTQKYTNEYLDFDPSN